MKTETYKDSQEALRALTNRLAMLIEQAKGDVFNLALSGGETAKQMFVLWAQEYQTTINWNTVRFYWVDERCVPKTDEQSNYGQANKLFFEPMHIPKRHIHRIKGENYPQAEAKRYSDRVSGKLLIYNGLPRFDCIILGVGNDAHTASIFPNTMRLLEDERPYAVSQHPQTGQCRVTMTGLLILNNTPLLVPILGQGKTEVIKHLKNAYSKDNPTPASYILSKAKDATVYLAEE
ncbi:6-phosphogluconolactonase [Parabacteroides sp. PF5-5]|uniref:6-phosphogluconolactonase n=1 Tax=unclassified Parabacteroides TaxID=2649774 RepID=UPI002474186A|nr:MULTISPECIES: 6-phosphogluconolactonase [unclassified Parabacteroides]MDH6304409.1 6-phosphogluconolactonase [Parabacteroides sp. PH5-39]MDH6315438.1 6-phosphogluconolactonase [Parabacteroides sp. PF5-13]MDH6319068.1 6-phosphogluconolactonase [Parabacteroides sp. PH5-13]MDH6322798.1 6-phosphogluconolactonase [Parabacteroides sp. PH5-8]MDH6326630.1 6-phosphogluconolactonase [Parabacteroides sp. PH5-41]